MNTCRFCHEWRTTPGNPMVQYGPRHNAHLGCGIDRWGNELANKLSVNTLRHLPTSALRKHPEILALVRAKVAAWDARGKAPDRGVRMTPALRDLLTGRYLDHQPSCRCAACESVRAKILIEDIERTYGSCTTIDAIALDPIQTEKALQMLKQVLFYLNRQVVSIQQDDLLDAVHIMDRAFTHLANKIDALPPAARMNWPYVADWKL